MDLYSRQIVGWATRSTMTSDLVLQALLAAVWKRKPGPGVMVHSDQGSQFTSDDWQSFLKAHHMVPSTSRRGNCHDNAVAESFPCAVVKARLTYEGDFRQAESQTAATVSPATATGGFWPNSAGRRPAHATRADRPIAAVRRGSLLRQQCVGLQTSAGATELIDVAACRWHLYRSGVRIF